MPVAMLWVLKATVERGQVRDEFDNQPKPGLGEALTNKARRFQAKWQEALVLAMKNRNIT